MNEWRHGLEGMVASDFTGTWVSPPDAQRSAENKINQLNAAVACGFEVPATLVSSDPPEVRAFCARHSGRVIAKALRGAATRATTTVLVGMGELSSDESIRACPAIYQEYIPGAMHLRAHVFGTSVSIVSIESEDLDWRRNLTAPFRRWDEDSELCDRLVSVVSRLGLRMGVIDLKVSSAGQVVWLEINPQGQFLFAEALSGVPLMRGFADFVEAEL